MSFDCSVCVFQQHPSSKLYLATTIMQGSSHKLITRFEEAMNNLVYDPTTHSTIASRQGRGESERKRSSALRLFQQSTNGDCLLSLGLRRSQSAATATAA
jgi:hypothetical protein